MSPSEEELFKCMTVGIMLRLGFQSMLAAAARQKGVGAMRWLNQFEARVLADARRITVHAPVSEKILYETVEALEKEFKEVFGEVRKTISADRARRRRTQRPELERRICRMRAFGARRRRRMS